MPRNYDVRGIEAAPVINAFQSGRQNALQRQLQGARQQAGNALAQGNYQGGINALAGVGDFQGATQLSQLEQQQHAQLKAAEEEYLIDTVSALNAVSNGSVPFDVAQKSLIAKYPQYKDRISSVTPEQVPILFQQLMGKEGLLAKYKSDLDIQSKLNEPFTLSPGAVRFGPNGVPIARVPSNPDKAGLIITGYDEMGRPLIQVGGTAPTGGSVKGPTNMPVSQEEADRLRDQVQAVNRVRTFLQDVDDQIQAGTGTWAQVRSAVNGLFSLIQEEAFPNTTDAKDLIRKFNQVAKEALVNNPRFPVAEQELVAGLLPNPNAILTTPQAELRKLIQLDQFLAQKGELGIETVRGGVEPPKTLEKPTVIAPGTIEDGYRFKGGDPGDPANWESVQ